MGELVQPNPPQTTQQTYAEKIHRVFNEINEGQLFHINDNECFFKLRIRQNHPKFHIDYVDDVTRYRYNSSLFNLIKGRKEDFTEFINDVVALNEGYVGLLSLCCDRKIRREELSEVTSLT